jgi:hypothetical protein
MALDCPRSYLQDRERKTLATMTEAASSIRRLTGTMEKMIAAG